MEKWLKKKRGKVLLGGNSTSSFRKILEVVSKKDKKKIVQKGGFSVRNWSRKAYDYQVMGIIQIKKDNSWKTPQAWKI